MGQLLADRRDVDFVLFEQMNVEQFTKTEKFADFGKKTIDMIISEARSLAICFNTVSRPIIIPPPYCGLYCYYY